MSGKNQVIVTEPPTPACPTLRSDLAKLVRPGTHVPNPRNVDGGVWILGLSLLDDLALSRGSDHGALTTLMLGAETSVCSGLDINLFLCHGLLLRLAVFTR